MSMITMAVKQKKLSGAAHASCLHILRKNKHIFYKFINHKYKLPVLVRFNGENKREK